MAQYIRPTLRTHRGCYNEPRRLHPEDRARLLLATPPIVRRVTEWTPSLEYELIARTMLPEDREAYIAKSVAWFEAHPTVTRSAAPARSEGVDIDAVVAMFAKWGSAAPLEEYHRVGYSEAAVERVRAQRAWFTSHADELQAEIERRWPGSASSKPKKVIKAVKKKMP
jgi:hypothetical protein